MLYAAPPKSAVIKEIRQEQFEILLLSDSGMIRILPYSDSIFRITYTNRKQFSDRIKPGILPNPAPVELRIDDTEHSFIVKTSKVSIFINKQTASFEYYDNNGNLYLKERSHDSKILESYQAYALHEDERIHTQKIQTADGIKELVMDATHIPTEELYHTKLYLEWQEEEALYGLGQQEEGILNLRGNTIYLQQANRIIAVPMLVSTKHYGILMDTYSPMIFHDDIYGSYLYTEADVEMDYYFIAGKSMDDVIKGYRYLTGKAAMLPRWAFGYIQSQERYETADEMIATVKEYRKREIGLDGIVLDWCSWEDNQWGQKSFDPVRFPDPAKMMEELHKLDAHFMISVWPNMAKGTANHTAMEVEGMLLPASEIYNAFDPKGRELYWKQAMDGIFQYGIDAWWCDSSEPITVEWTHLERMEPSALFHEYCKEMADHMPAWEMNAFSFYHAMALYEGQRSVTCEKRVCNLTRSAYTGQQRFGTILWSGDISASWSTFQKQIVNSLNFSASGLPYWTVDVGAFFVKHSNIWYWDGDFPDTTNDYGYLELYTRWYQWACFLPVFRAHGTDCRRELWAFEKEDHRFYEAMVKANELRYRLLPYIYSLAGKVWLRDETMIKLLAFDFDTDQTALSIKDEYLFGDAFLVCPVTEPMLYEANNRKLSGIFDKSIYLPQGESWYDFWTGQYYEGGQWITITPKLDQIPVFVKAGSILPMHKGKVTNANTLSEIEWHVYPGKDARYEYYEDTGDGYGYEAGEYHLTKLSWNDSLKKLTSEKDGEISCVIH